MGKDLGVGVIGLGMGRNMLFLNRRQDTRLQVRAICDTNLVRLQQLGREFEIPFLTTEYEQLVARKDIDVVGVFTPDHLHAAHCLAALKAGKHVVCTKPMTTSSADCREIIRLCERKRLKFLVGQTCRFVPAFAAAKRMVDDGDLGEIIFGEAHYVHDMRSVFPHTPWRLEAPQDFLFGGACHPLDLLRWFLGDVEEVHVYANKGGLEPRYPLPENFLINLRFASGRIARILAAYGLVEPPMPMLGLSVFGTKGSFVNDKVVLDKMEGKPTLSLSFPPEAGHGGEVVRYMEHFEECLLEDKQPLIDAREGAKVISTCKACWESIRTGLPARVHNDF